METAIVILGIALAIVIVAAAVLLKKRNEQISDWKKANDGALQYGRHVEEVSRSFSSRMATAESGQQELAKENYTLSARNAELNDQLKTATDEKEKMTARCSDLETIKTTLESREQEATAEVQRLKAPLPTFPKKFPKAKKKLRVQT